MSYWPNIPTSSPWKTVLDLDLTNCGTQTMATDTTYTFGGLTWTKHSSANDAVSTQLTAGTGLTFQPNSTGDYNNTTQTFPRLFLPFSQLAIPNFDWRSSVRVWMHITNANPTANYDNSVLYIGDDGTNWNYILFRGYNGQLQGWLRRTVAGSSTSSGGFVTTINNTTNNVMTLSTEDSIWDPAFHGGLNHWQASGSPTWPILTSAWLSGHDATGNQTDGYAGNAGSPGAMGIGFGALRAGSSTAFITTFAHMRVDVHN